MVNDPLLLTVFSVGPQLSTTQTLTVTAPGGGTVLSYMDFPSPEKKSGISKTVAPYKNIKMSISADIKDKQLRQPEDTTQPTAKRTDGFVALTDIIKQHKTLETLELTVGNIPPNDPEICKAIANLIAAIEQSKKLKKLTLNLMNTRNQLIKLDTIQQINSALREAKANVELMKGSDNFRLYDLNDERGFIGEENPQKITSMMDGYRNTWASISNTLINNTSRPLMGISAFTFLTGVMIPILNKTWEENPYDGGAAEVFMVAAAMLAVVGGGMALVAKRGDSATLAVGYTLAWIGAVAIAAAAAWTLYAGEAIEYSTDPSQIYQVDNATEKLYTAMYIMTGVGAVATAIGVGKTAYNRGF